MHAVRSAQLSRGGLQADHRPRSRSRFVGMAGAAVLAAVLLIAGCSDPPVRPQHTPTSEHSNTDLREKTVVDVRSCEKQSPYNQLPDDPIPDSVRLPSPLTLPRGAAVAGLLAGRGDAVHYVLGPDTGTCQVVFGASSIHVSLGSADGRSGVQDVFSPGGAAYAARYGCEYLPEVARLSPGEECTKPPGHEMAPLSTGVPDLHASLVWAQPNSRSDLWGGRPLRYGTVALFVSHTTQGPAGKSISCSLPDREDDICTASLSYFLAQMGEASGMTERDRQRLTQVIRTFVTQHRA